MSGILIIDDPASSRDSEHVRAVAGGLDLSVSVEFASGEETVARLTGELPELIVIDVSPAGEMDGVGMVRELRQRAPHTTIIACGKFDDAATVSELYEIGVHRCLRKPLRNEELLRLLEEHRQRELAPA